ncbi:MAG: c-type cytochrome biogenesis protein CcsB, partial [Nocardioidaceae bacterium]
MTAADFAAFSNNAIAFASVVYVLAFLSHIVEWAMGRSVPASADGAPVAVAAVSDSSHADATYAGPDHGTAVGPDTGPLTATATGPETERKALGVERFGRIGVALTVLAFGLHLAGLVTRGLAADPARVPWGNMYEFAVAGALGVTGIYLALLRKYQLRWLGLLVTGFAVVVLMLAVLLLYVPAGPLVPALHSYWLVIHVIAAVIGAGAFTVGAMASLLFLVKRRAETKPDAPTTGYVARLPAASALDRVAYRVHAFGFPVWTFAALVAGPIWAEYAWGRYWGWDPKEVWAFITWVVYAAYLHARATAGWKGKG